MTTLCLCDLVETNSERVRRTLNALQEPATPAASLPPLAPTIAMRPPVSRAGVPIRPAQLRGFTRFADPAA